MEQTYSEILNKLSTISAAWKAQFQEPHGQYWVESFFDQQYPDLPLEWKIRDDMVYLDNVWICPASEISLDTLNDEVFVTPVTLEFDLCYGSLTIVIAKPCGEFEIVAVERSVFSRETRDSRVRAVVNEFLDATVNQPLSNVPGPEV